MVGVGGTEDGDDPGQGCVSANTHVQLRIPLMADSDSTVIADSIPCDGGHPAPVS